MSTHSMIQHGAVLLPLRRKQAGAQALQRIPAAGEMRFGSLGALFLGPLLGLLYITLLPLAFILVGFLMLPGLLLAKTETVTLSGNSAVCMGCHEGAGMTKDLKNGEKLQLQVDAKKLRRSVHSFLECTDCHQSISPANHPAGSVYQSKRDFALKTAVACKTCHNEQALMKKPVHYQAATRANAPPCIDCHSGHGVTKVAAVKQSLTDNAYCLTCHAQDIKITSINTTASISEQKLKQSVHSSHRCADCHRGFSKEQHPIKKYASAREHGIALADTCKGCHADKLVQMNGSIHASMLRQKNLTAPVCTDCHGFHDVTPKAAYATMSGVPCKKCHEAVFAEYAGSVHGAAKMNGKQAPLCSSCHRAHEVKATALNSGIRDACLGCHGSASKLHEKWLPNTALHLDAVSCAVCHSPHAERGVVLTLVNKETGAPVTDEQLKTMLGDNYRELIGLANPQGTAISDRGLQNIVGLINDKSGGLKVAFRGSLALKAGAGAHDLALKAKAVKECEKCHSADSPFFKNVTVAIGKDNGTALFLTAQKEVLGSLFSVLPAGEFYVLGGTRVRMLDYVGVLMVMGGATFPLAHLAIRALTAPIRRNRKEGK